MKGSLEETVLKWGFERLGSDCPAVRKSAFQGMECVQAACLSGEKRHAVAEDQGIVESGTRETTGKGHLSRLLGLSSGGNTRRSVLDRQHV